MHVTIIDKNCTEFYDLCNLRGKLFQEWLDIWIKLSSEEKDIYTHPVYMMSWLKAKAKHSQENFKLFFLMHNNEVIGCIPFQIYTVPTFPKRLIYLKSPVVELGSSVAIKKKYRKSICDLLLNMRVGGSGKPFSIVFLQIDETNTFFETDVRKIVKKNDFSRTILNVRNGYGEILNNCSSKFRYNLKKTKDKALSLGNLHLDISQEKPQITEMFNLITEFEMTGWKKDEHKAMKKNDFINDFYLSVVEGFSELGQAAIITLKTANKQLASTAILNLEHCIYGLKIAYNAEYASLSPGTLLLDRIFEEYCPRENITTYNVMSTSEWFRKAWKADTLHTYGMYIFPNTRIGICEKYIVDLYIKFKKRNS